MLIFEQQINILTAQQFLISALNEDKFSWCDAYLSLGLHKPQKEFTDFIEAFALLKS
jgi:hypothetical protein